MAKGVFYHKDGSGYKDIRGNQYHFPKTYRSRVEQTVGDWVMYYGPIAGEPSRYYSGIAMVDSIEDDRETQGHYYAILEDYLDFDRLVGYTENGGYEIKLFTPNGSVNSGRSVQAVRLIEDAEFVAIVNAGLSTPDEWPNRTDTSITNQLPPGVSDTSQAGFDLENYERPIVTQVSNRPFRDVKFRQNIRRIYDRTCAFTGLRLINGGGRPEVEAAHIVPVDRGGNDSVQNGIALSGTVHWMFDRGLLSLADDFSILQSRHINYDVSHLLNRDMVAKVPAEQRLRPHPHYLAWHRENIFKQ
jgi:putative restriction endonuclease